MRHYLYVMATVALLLFLPSRGKAQAVAFNYDIKNGLPDNSVNCITQDRNGFMWVGTSNGLARFDGLFFTVFRHDHDDASTIANNNIHAFHANRHGFYFSTDLGVDFYDNNDNRFHHCVFPGQKTYNRILTFASTSKGLFATDDIGRLYTVQGTMFIRVRKDMRAYAIATVSGYGQQECIVATGNHRLTLMSADGKRVLSSVKTPIGGTNKNVVYYSKRQRKLYVGNGIGTSSASYKIENDRIVECADHVPANLKAVTDFNGGTAFATDGQGVMALDGTNKRWLKEDHGAICGNAIYSAFADNGGNLWIGSYRKGMTQFQQRGLAFNLISEATHTLPFDLVTAVTSQGGNVYIGMDGGGMSVMSRSTHSVTTTYTSANSDLWGDNIVSMVADANSVWMAVYNKGLTRFDTKTHRFTNYDIPLRSNHGDIIWTICDSHDGNLWIGGRDVQVFNKSKGTFHPVKELIGSECQAISLNGQYVWVGTPYGVYKIDKKTLRVVKHYDKDTKGMPLSTNSVRYLYADSRGRVWVSFSYDDICCIDEKNGKVTTYDMSQGLENETVTGIVESRFGHMVFATSNGLYFFFPSNGNFMRFDLDNQIPESYNYGACHVDGNCMYFGSTEGLVWTTDMAIRPSTLFSRVSFNALSLANGRSLSLGMGNNEPIVLHHNENYFTIHFSVPEYMAPRAIRFSYYLKGMETEWKDMTDHREAQYTNVPPGTYEFMVRCTDLNGKWTRPSVLRITVLPPWYLTWWAKTLWALLIIGIAYLGVWLYMRELKLHHKMQLAEMEKESQRKIDDAKMNFFTSITHELRTPVFLIAAQLEELINNNQSMVNVPKTYLMAMHRGAVRINKLISRAIDFRKMDEGKLTLKRQRINATAFVRDLADDYIDLCDQKEIDFNLSLPDHPVWAMMDGEKIEMCINNLMSNAYKYTNANGHVTLSVEDNADYVVFSVKDDGIGIVPKAREEIFQSFYRTRRGEAHSQGDGIGLAFVQKLVELHGGKMQLESEVNKGSTFSLFIPKDGNVTDATPAETKEPIVQATEDETRGNDSKQEGDAEDTVQAAVKSQVKSNPTATHTILLIDDERDIVRLLERNLVSDFHVLKAYNGKEGLEIAAKSLPDLIVCDMMMPELDGLEFLRTLKNDKKLRQVKVIIFTGQTSEEERIKAYDAGADAYITKPVSLKLLRTRIDRLIAESDNAALTTSIAKGKKSYNKEEQIFLLRCREIIDDNLANPDFNVDFLAQKLAMSHSTLYKKLKQMTGMSLIEFVNDYKIYKAVTCFKEGQTNVERVAEQCGFSDIKNFRTQFKRKMQVTPKQFVQSL